MTVNNWPSAVNSDFFNFSYAPKNNCITQEFLSGRRVAWQANTKNLKVITCKIMVDTSQELPAFYSWFNDELGQLAGVFTCASLGAGAYRFTEIPQPQDTDQNRTILELSLEEV